MCLDVEYDDEVKFETHTKPKARKPHRCTDPAFAIARSSRARLYRQRGRWSSPPRRLGHVPHVRSLCRDNRPRLRSLDGLLACLGTGVRFTALTLTTARSWATDHRQSRPWASRTEMRGCFERRTASGSDQWRRPNRRVVPAGPKIPERAPPD